jgi:heptaprenyl diphosphate synthase
MNQEQIKEYLYSYTQQSVDIVRGYLRSEFAMNEFLREHLDELTSSLEVLKNVVGEG